MKYFNIIFNIKFTNFWKFSKPHFQITFLLLFFFNLSFAQETNTVSGLVVDQDQTPLIGATLTWLGTTDGAITNENGYFKIENPANQNQLVVSYVGFESDTVEVAEGTSEIIVFLSLGVDLGEVVITEKLRDHYASAVKAFNVETIGSGELRKAACCNLSESFETNGAVNVSYSDAVTGAKEIEMLGLRGVYSQMLLENRPTMRGLGYPFGMEYIPGTWVSKIDIAKGASTVTNGYEGITGKINVELIKPFNGERVHVNGYGNHVGRSELNVHLNHKINDKWSIGTLLHGDYMDAEVDHGEDGFLDIPRKQMLNGLMRLFYRGENVRGQFNVQALSHQIRGGQVGYDNDPTNLYGFELLTNRVEAFGKIGYLGFANPFASIGWITNLTLHQNDGFFGKKGYDATQRSLYTNLMYQSVFQTSEHTYKTGISYQLDDYDEVFDGIDYSLMESVVGGYFEYAYSRPAVNGQKALGIVGGLRVDYHNLYGVFITPRFNFKYNFDDNTVVRLTAGRGYRTARILAENISALTSARTINLTEALQPEDAINAGINFVKNGTLLNKDISFSADLYTTRFLNQIVMDRETVDDEILFYNLEGESYSNSFLTTLVYDLTELLELKLSYKYNDVKINYNGRLLQVPLVAKHRGLVTLGYTSPSKAWKIHTTTQFVGPQRLPTLLGHENHSAIGHASLTDYHLRGESPPYVLLSGQITYVINDKWEVYLGGENLTNYQQHNPIIGASDPFNQDIGIPVFDASQVYAPIMGTMVYGGFRYTLK